MNAALLPVNQRIVGGEPAISQDGRHRLVKRSNIEIYIEDFSGRKVYGQGGKRIYEVVRGTVKQLKSNRGYGGSWKVVYLREFGVDKTMGRAGVDESTERGRDRVGVQVKEESMGVGKSGRVEPEDLRTGGVNADLAGYGVRRSAD